MGLSINNNVGSLRAHGILQLNNLKLNNTLKQLSTGLRINSGADDPAGLIASETLRSEIKAIDAASDNASRADMVMNTAEGGMREVSNILVDMKGLAVAANNSFLSKEEKAALQMQMDSSLDAINRIAGSTSFGGQKLLDGSMDYQVASVAAGVTGYQIDSASVPNGGQNVQVNVTQAAEQAGTFVSFNEAPVNPAGDGTVNFKLSGSAGSAEFAFADGTSLSDMATQINQCSGDTGVTATVHTAINGTQGLIFSSNEYGSAESVSVQVTDDGGFQGKVYELDSTGAVDLASGQTLASLSGGSAVTDYGVDVAGTINGQAATGEGLTLSVNSSSLDMSVTMDVATATTVASFKAMKITGGGATFAVSPDLGATVSIGIHGMTTASLGKVSNGAGGFHSLADLASGGALNLVSGDVSKASASISQAISQVATQRGRVGAFQRNTLEPTIRSLAIARENLTAAESTIRDTDYARATSDLTRNRLLMDAAAFSLAIANNRPRSVLSLLG